MIGRPLIRLDAVKSTQDVVFRLAERGAPEGTTVLTRFQSDGHGRAGRAWSVPPDEALLFSVLLRPSLTLDRLGPLSILIGDAVAAALADLYHPRPSVKWPNDVLLNGLKVSGVLIQTRLAAKRGVAVVGVGINVSSTRDDLPDGATSIQAELGCDVDREVLFQSVLPRIEERYRDLQQGCIDRYVTHVNDILWLRDQNVVIDDAGRRITGRLGRVDVDGALLLHTPDGARRIVSGEMTRGPRSLLP